MCMLRMWLYMYDAVEYGHSWLMNWRCQKNQLFTAFQLFCWPDWPHAKLIQKPAGLDLVPWCPGFCSENFTICSIKTTRNAPNSQHSQPVFSCQSACSWTSRQATPGPGDCLQAPAPAAPAAPQSRSDCEPRLSEGWLAAPTLNPTCSVGVQETLMVLWMPWKWPDETAVGTNSQWRFAKTTSTCWYILDKCQVLQKTEKLHEKLGANLTASCTPPCLLGIWRFFCGRGKVQLKSKNLRSPPVVKRGGSVGEINLPIGWHISQLVYRLSIQSYAINPHGTLVNTISHRPPWSNDPPVIPWRHGLWTESIDGASLALESVDNVHSLVGWSLCIVVYVDFLCVAWVNSFSRAMWCLAILSQKRYPMVI